MGMTHDEAMRYRLTPDFTMRPLRQPTPAEYALSMRILRDFHAGRGHEWRMRDLSDLEHDVLMSLYRAGILEQSNYTLEHRITKYGEVYFMQRQDGSARDRGTRNVRWHEDRQDRASALAYRLSNMARRLTERAIDLFNEARTMRVKGPKAVKKREALEREAERLSERARQYAERAQAARGASSRYGRAKTKVGTYDSEGGRGWVDRDRSRPRKKKSASARRSRVSSRRRRSR